MLTGLVPDYIEQLVPYKAGRPIYEVQREFGLERVIKLASNENPWGPSPHALEAIKAAVAEVHRYPDANAWKLREALAHRYSLSHENIIVGNGSEGIMACITRAFLHDDDEVLTSDAAFLGFPVLCRTRGIEPIAVPLNEYRFDLAAIADRITPRTKLIYLCNPNNPTGTYFTKAEFDRFMVRVPDRVLVILDEAYYEYARAIPSYPDSMDYRHDNVITLRTFSKAYGLAGFRVGYGFGHPDLIRNLWKVKLPFEPGVLGQAAGVAALDDEEFLKTCVRANGEGRDLLFAGLERLGLEYLPSVTNFVTFFAPAEREVQDIFHEMLRRGVIIRPLEQAGLPRCLRISVGTPEELEIALATLEEVLSG